MGPDASFAAPLIAAAAGLAVSVAIERLMIPAPAWSRPPDAWYLHAGIWLVCYGMLVALVGRPWFALAAAAAAMLVLVLVNNAKMRALREPFVLPDFEYFTDAIRHPRLYIPFMGWGNFVAAAAGFALAVAVGFLGESAPAERFAWSGQLGAVLLIVVAGVVALAIGRRAVVPVGRDANADVQSLGLLASLWRYGEARRTPPRVESPFQAAPRAGSPGELPHLVAVQSESFFDPRSLFAGIRADVLREFDRVGGEALLRGALEVPAWGANTVRTEFAFLSGIAAGDLGVHRFNPYHAVGAGWRVASLASYLKRLGYRTVCIHPYPASFYQRDRVYPCLGFDEFIDIRAFAGAARCGPYVGDAAVGEMIATLLADARGPLFVHAVTMENHGPLHLEQVAPGDLDELYVRPPPPGCEDLTIYLRHLRNADRMIGRLREAGARCASPVGFCWFGDHVPIMPAVYEALGAPSGQVDFLVWSNRAGAAPGVRDMAVHRLAGEWMRAMGLT